MSGEGGPVLQLGGEHLQAAGARRYRLPGGRQAGHRGLVPVRPVALPPHVHGVALRPLLGGEGGGVAQAVVVRLVWGRQSVSGGHPRASRIQELRSTGLLWNRVIRASSHDHFVE